MRNTLVFGRVVLRSLLKDIGHVEATISVIAVFSFLLLVAMPWSSLGLEAFWLRIIGLVILNLLFLRGAYKAWANVDIDREQLRNIIESKAPNVELIRFDHELQYEVNKNNNGLIEIHVFGELINKSMDYSGRLSKFWIDVPTKLSAAFRAEAPLPECNYLFEHPSIYPSKHFIFIGEMADYIATEVYHIKSWEPYIRGRKGRIYLEVLGQELKTYEIKIEDEGKVYE